MPVRLVVRLNDRVLRFPLAGEAILGSAPDCPVHVPHFTVSRRHAVLRVRGEEVEIEDLGSKNGTQVRGVRIAGAVAVHPGDPLAFGGVDGVIEAVGSSDLEVAVELAPPAPPPGAVEPNTPATSPMGALSRFTLVFLPELARALAEGRSAEQLAGVVGLALAETTQALGVEIAARRGGREGVVFTFGRPDAAVGRLTQLPVPGGSWVVRVRLASELQERGFAPLFEACVWILGAALGKGQVPAGAWVQPAAPPLPDPPSVVPAMRRLYTDAARIARGDVSVLLRGESGTGKEVLARFIHAASPRAAGGFVPLNCAALPRDLLEAELFGVERGAATGVEARPGKFELADGGTLFLDEIADMAPDTQAKILRVLQEREVFRLGATQPRPAHVRVISATNRDLDSMLAAGTFRADLYHRIADWEVTIPPLRQRRADIPNLAAFFLAREAGRRGITVAGISRGAVERLQGYSWPGNVRQLEREMARVVLFLEDGEAVESGHLQERIRLGDQATAEGSLGEVMDDAERRAILAALADHGGDTAAAAQALGIGRSTLYRRLKALGVTVPR